MNPNFTGNPQNLAAGVAATGAAIAAAPAVAVGVVVGAAIIGLGVLIAKANKK